jgi:hypothetical protein
MPHHTLSVSPANWTLDRERYLALAKTQGVEVALTALHREIATLEVESFEGQEGWRPDLWQQLEAARVFQRELWSMELADPSLARKTENPPAGR